MAFVGGVVIMGSSRNDRGREAGPVEGRVDREEEPSRHWADQACVNHGRQKGVRRGKKTPKARADSQGQG